MSKRVLILSSQDDAHAARVQTHLNEMSVKSLLWRFDSFIQECSLSFRLSEEQDRFKLKFGDKLIDMRSVDAIWFRRPGHPIASTFFQPWIGSLIEMEARQALQGMLFGLPCLWVNFPARDTTASLKLFQLQIAKFIGLRIPETIVTNDPEIAKSFFEKFKGQVIYKLISESSNFCLPRFEFPHGIPTLPLRESDLEHLDQVRHGPHLFQQKVDKQSDVRVTVIGQKVFAANIESQVGTGKLDWRNDYTVPMSACALPDELSQKCLALLRALGLNYGAFDFCLDMNGEYIFLEVNPAGQYLWLEERTQQNLSREMASLLAGCSEPLVSYSQAVLGNQCIPELW